MKPELEIYSHLSPEILACEEIDRLLAASNKALGDILNLPIGPEHVLADLDTVEISIVDDEAIAAVHGQFLNDPSPTDVITFPHGDGLGEIMVSLETAIRQAGEFGEPRDRELFRYIVHGLLHLHGYLDTVPEERELMFSYQEPLVVSHWS